jgi:AraC-like DNA-binding protein
MIPKTQKGRPRLEGRVIRAAGAIILVDFLRECGVDGHALVANAGLPKVALRHPDNLIRLVALGRLVVSAAEATGRADIGLAVGSRVTFGALGMVGYLVANAETVGAGLETLTRYLHLNNNAVVPYLAREGERVVVGYEPLGAGFAGESQLMFAAMAILTNSLRALCGREFQLRAAAFAYSAPSDRRAFNRFFGVPVAFNETRTAITFDRAWLPRRISGSDPTLRRVLERQIRAATPPRNQPAAAGQVQRVLRTMLPAGTVSEVQVARAFGMNRRTLARRLQEAGTTFQEQLDLARSETARTLLEGGDSDIANIAAKLGYAGTSSFTRAFRRWEGTTPTEWRARARKRNS